MKKHFSAYNLFLSFIALMSLTAILAPILMALGLEEIAKYIYFVYSFFCHQIHYRSLHVFDYQYAWCTRDTFIWFSLLFAAIYVKKFGFKGLKWYQVVLFVIPIALDGGGQLIATFVGLTGDDSDILYASTNFSRMLTGSLLGIGLGLWIFPVLRSVDEEGTKETVKAGAIKVVSLLISFSFFVYLVLVGTWALTSPNYKPDNVIDWSNRFPENKDEWFIRRQHATCPVDAQEEGFFDLDCEM